MLPKTTIKVKDWRIFSIPERYDRYKKKTQTYTSVPTSQIHKPNIYYLYMIDYNTTMYVNTKYYDVYNIIVNKLLYSYALLSIMIYNVKNI